MSFMASQHTFLNIVADLNVSLETAVDTLRLYGRREVPSLGALIPTNVLARSGLSLANATQILNDYLNQTAVDYNIGASDHSDYRTPKDAIQRNTSIFSHQASLWKKQVYNLKRRAIDRAMQDLEQRIRRAIVRETAAIVEKLSPCLEYDELGQLVTNTTIDSSILAPALQSFRARLYDAAHLKYHDDPELLYQLCFRAVAEQRGWNKLRDQQLTDALAAENVPLEVLVHYTGWQTTAQKSSSTPAAARVVTLQQPPIDPAVQDLAAAVGGRVIRPLAQAVIIPGAASTVQIRDFDENFLVFENIVCYDAVGNVTEQYPSLRVRKQVYRDSKDRIISKTPYKAIVHAEEQGDFNPCSALTTALLVAAYRGRQNAGVNTFLEQYKDKGNGNGYHLLNTITQWQRGQARLIHYPHLTDFPEANRGTTVINQSRQHRSLEFAVDTSFGDKLVGEVSSSSQFAQFLRSWYGLPDLGIVVEIGNRFSKPAKALVANNPTTANYTSGAWLGCYYGYFFDSDSFNGFDYSDAFRGVR